MTTLSLYTVVALFHASKHSIGYCKSRSREKKKTPDSVQLYKMQLIIIMKNFEELKSNKRLIKVKGWEFFFVVIMLLLTPLFYCGLTLEILLT